MRDTVPRDMLDSEVVLGSAVAFVFEGRLAAGIVVELGEWGPTMRVFPWPAPSFIVSLDSFRDVVAIA